MTAKRWMRSKPFVGPATLLGTAALSNSRVRSLLNEQEKRTAYLIEGAGTQTIRLAFDDSEIQPTTIKSREGDPSIAGTDVERYFLEGRIKGNRYELPRGP